MDKFFDIIKKLRVPAQQGKISRQSAIDALMQESGVSEEIAARAADNLFKAAPEGGITTLPQAEVIEASFKPGMDKRGKVVEESPSQASGSRNLLTEEEAPGLFSLRRDIESLADEESWKYSMSLYKQKKSKAMEPVYQKYGAQTQKDKELVDELYDVDFENKLVPNEFKSKPEYKESTAKIFIQESVEDIAGADDIVTSILYSDEATKFLENQGLDNYINYIHTQLKDQGLSFNKPLLKRFLKEKFEPEVFAVGGRVGFKGGVGRKGIIAGLADKLNEIAPGSTAVGKTTKAMNEAAKRKRAEEELFAGFNERNSPVKETVEEGRKILDVPPVPKGFSTSKEKLLEQFPEIDEGFAETMMQMDKDLLGRTIMMVKDRRRDPVLYDELLEKYGDSLEFQSQFDKAVRRKLNADGGLNYLMGF
jgi:hypothetical protein